VAALVTTASFLDVARLDLGPSGLGGDYNLQVGATDAAGELLPGQWQEADDPAGVPVALPGADALWPGGPGTTVDVPVRNDSPRFSSTLRLAVEALADDTGAQRATDPAYLSSLRFTVHMPGTSIDPVPATWDRLTYQAPADTRLNRLAPQEESAVSVTVELLSQDQSGAAHEDNALNGRGAALQLRLHGAQTYPALVPTAEQGKAVRSVGATSDTIIVTLDEAVYRSATRLVVTVNGTYISETFQGTAYSSSVSTSGGVVTVTTKTAGRVPPPVAGDVVEVRLVAGKPGASTATYVPIARYVIP
jgi:hypothetical protein